MSAWASSPWSAMLLAAAISAVALALLELGGGRLPHAQPSSRSLHDRPVARVGGVAIWAGFVPVALLAGVPVVGGQAWLAGWAAVTAISLADDWRGVRPAIRLTVHAVAAVAVAVAILRPDVAEGLAPAAAAGVALTALAFVWSANLFNFMDGNDGLAALMAISGFGAYGVAALNAGAPAEAYLALAAATLPFLAVNLPPARTFMGDGGSVPLGFLAAVFGFSGVRTGIWPAWFPLLVFLPFLADATVTVLRRIASGEHVFEPHRMHYYQRLHRMGGAHRGTLFFFGVLIAGTSASALFALAAGPEAGWFMFCAWAAAIGVIFAGIDCRWRKRSPGP